MRQRFRYGRSVIVHIIMSEMCGIGKIPLIKLRKQYDTVADQQLPLLQSPKVDACINVLNGHADEAADLPIELIAHVILNVYV